MDQHQGHEPGGLAQGPQAGHRRFRRRGHHGGHQIRQSPVRVSGQARSRAREAHDRGHAAGYRLRGGRRPALRSGDRPEDHQMLSHVPLRGAPIHAGQHRPLRSGRRIHRPGSEDHLRMESHQLPGRRHPAQLLLAVPALHGRHRRALLVSGRHGLFHRLLHLPHRAQ